MYKNRAFSLLELLIVVAILAIIGAIGSGFYVSYGKNISIKSTAQTILFDLKNAQSKSMAGVDGYKWGIRFVNSTTDYYEIFSTPTDYSAATSFLPRVYLTDSISFSDPATSSTKDIIFNKISGGTSDSTITINTSTASKTVNISSIGNIYIQ